MIIYKNYQIKPHKTIPTCYIVVTDGQGGKVPAMLTGMYTNTTFAKQDIDRYLDSKPVKEPKNAKEVGQG